jgi:hypothetical protein
MTQELKDKQIVTFRNSLATEEQATFDLGLQIIQEYMPLFQKLAKT